MGEAVVVVFRAGSTLGVNQSRVLVNDRKSGNQPAVNVELSTYDSPPMVTTSTVSTRPTSVWLLQSSMWIFMNCPA